MSPELVLVLRIALLSAALVGLESVLRHRVQQGRWSYRRARTARFVQPDPVVRFRVSAPPAQQVTVKHPATDAPQPLTPIVRLEPLPHKPDHVTEKRAA